MAYNLSAFAGAGAQFFDNNGDILSGGLLYVYTAGTTTPVTTWTSNSGAVANTNPIVLDSAGRVPYEIWLNSGVTYKFVLKTSTGVTIGTYDNIPAIDDPTVFNNLITVTGTNTLTGTSVPPYTAYVAGMTISFVPINTNTGAVTIDIDGLGAKNIYVGSSSPLSGGEIVAGRIVQLEYDGTRFQLNQSSIADGSVTTAKLADAAVTTVKIADANVTLAKIQNIASSRLLGRSTAGSGVVEELTPTSAKALLGFVADVQTFTSTGTWTKPTGGQTMARIQVWGGGGGGGRINYNNGASGGGGGAYQEITVPLSYLAASLTATVGSGGAGATTSANGGNGGSSNVPLATAVNGQTQVIAYGGGGGGYSGGGGGGGGSRSAGGAGGLSAPGAGGLGYGGFGVTPYDSGGSGGYSSCSTSAGYGSIFGGGGGGAGSSVAGTQQGAGSVWGGGGGSSALASSTTYSGGVSQYGGAGGNGSTTAPTAGAQPGGGGGASGNANITGGAGGAGQVVITCW